MRNPEVGADDNRLADSAFPPPDSVIFESVDGELRQSTASPAWLDRIKACTGSEASLTEYLPYLESFLPEARSFWDEGGDGQLVSDFWTQTDASGDKVHLLAYALALKGQQSLLIRSVEGLYLESERAQSYAHTSVKRLKLAALWQRGLEKMTAEPKASDVTSGQLQKKDALTGISSRQHFDEMLEAALRSANEQNEPISILFLGIDQFQRFNDQYGRVAGDIYLRAVGQLIEGVLSQPRDLASRVGGDQFATLLPGSDGTEAVRLAHTLLGMIRELRVPNPMSRGLMNATMSIGVLSRPSNSHQTAEQLLAAAESALREAKRSGRDRLAIGDPPI
jgi:diguanylate cyclase (GGDEF)-like protein